MPPASTPLKPSGLNRNQPASYAVFLIEQIDEIELPKEQIVSAKPIAVVTGIGDVKVTRMDYKSKEAAQQRLAQDIKRVGYVRGEIYQLKDGSWDIHWGGEYPLRNTLAPFMLH